MKKISILFAIGLSFILLLPRNVAAQSKAYLVLEYMHVKPDNNKAYIQTESFWRHIHQQRQKNGTILSWAVWAVEAPYDLNADYQYVVATVYPHFSDYLHRYEGIDTHQVFPDASEDSLRAMFTRTAKARDLVRSLIYVILYDNRDMNDTAHYMLITEMKAAQGKEDAYISLEMKDWKPIHDDLLKKGFESGCRFARLVFPSDAGYPYDYSVFRFFNDAGMFDKMDGVDWAGYRKANPAAFTNTDKLRTEVHTELLRKVVSLASAPE